MKNWKWSPRVAYAVGLITSDGCLLNDGRHIDLTSKDREQLRNFRRCLDVSNSITRKASGFSRPPIWRIQIGDVSLYRFLLSIGLCTRKSKILGSLKIPDNYFFHFLRGFFDGDGTFYSYHDPRWPASYLFYTVFYSASLRFLVWVRATIKRQLSISGHMGKYRYNSVYSLRYAKQESLKLLPRLYPSKSVIRLSRKHLKIKRALDRM